MKTALKIIIVIIVVGAVIYFIYRHNQDIATSVVPFKFIPNLELPCDTATIIRHYAYSFSYNEKHELANWVAYQITRNELIATEERSDRFKPDKQVTTGTAENKDYSKSGYDKGHLAPAADMAFSEIAMQESFYFSNIAPQAPAFNRGAWKELEEKTREWGEYFDSIYIITGPVLHDTLQMIGKNAVSVPEYFFKALVCYTKNSQKAIGFLMPNQRIETSIFDYVVSIDQIEERTKLDLFCKLPDNLESEIEKSIDTEFWLTAK